MRIIYGTFGDLWLRIAAFATRSSKKFTGSTLTSNTVVLRSDLKGDLLASALSHELVHVAQINRMGWFKMRWTFFLQDMKNGHQKAPLEIEAFERSNEFLPMAKGILNDSEFV